MESNQWVACWGNPNEGFQLVGLFTDPTLAMIWCEEHIYTDSWWVIEVQTTEDFDKENEGV
jgi:hypothetical protein